MNQSIKLASGVTLNTKIDGPDTAPWLILSNSLGADLTMWDEQIAFLTASYRVLRYDTRGHGASDVPSGPYSFDGLVGDVIGLMDALEIETAHFMGLSMGGMTGLGLSLNHADRITRVVCADGRADAPAPFVAMWDQRMAAVADGGLEAIADGTLGTWLTADWQAANPARTKSVRDMVTATNVDGYIACCKALQKLDYLKSLGDVKIPVLFVGGREDVGASPETMGAMAAATPGGKYIEIADAAHVANINAPEAFNASIKRFLDL
ncbi:3-oxoadipate enol-lactonase [Octadecabacter temperatus]|uniref:3-oxoadipate enol-lactonase 2 n=1 Tax=Octadecabacter temperatus TaxID=1458307 RepID=A0A0K0Y328_9RHOB|nr:3-oxoadipate enol-lactonase [Octadecabacter temperatus]AKS45360.1 3-oxoadipate enol-lactonase 2 [Octadecabacter temperatus]SIN91273.1 3-oxoadipate enol-lactonase [Octadecabacter temperatus]